MKMIDCGVVPGKDMIPYIPIPIPFIGIILTPLFNMIIRMGDIEFFYGYVGIRFLIYFMFQLPVKLMLSSDKVTESIKKSRTCSKTNITSCKSNILYIKSNWIYYK